MKTEPEVLVWYWAVRTACDDAHDEFDLEAYEFYWGWREDLRAKAWSMGPGRD